MYGNVRAIGAPPKIIWQKRPWEKVSIWLEREWRWLTSVLPLMAVEEKVREVPGATVPVFVTVSVGLAKQVSVWYSLASSVNAYQGYQDRNQR